MPRDDEFPEFKVNPKLAEKLRVKLVSQAGKPEGIEGSLYLDHLINENMEVTEWGISMVEISPNDSILEIGFGGGYNTGLMAPKLNKGVKASTCSVLCRS